MNRTIVNKKANWEITKQAIAKQIIRCEICNTSIGLTRMHRHKRRWYYDKPDELLWHFKQWIIACMDCHQQYEIDENVTKILFIKLRGEEDV